MEETWKRRTVASEPRLGEIVELYRSLGFEVKLEPVGDDDPYWDYEGCTLCLEDPSAQDSVRVVYTRHGSRAAKDAGEELFE